MTRVMRFVYLILLIAPLGACGTTYVLPNLDDEVKGQADKMFVDAKNAPPRALASQRTGEQRFQRVARRIEPVARQICENELAERPGVDCLVKLEIDRELQDRNAYFTYTGAGLKDPVIRFSLPILQDAASDDEVAFILGHEYGHLIGQHIAKQQQQAMVGALLLGAVAAYSNSRAASAGAYYDPGLVDDSVALGAALGGIAFSQTYELESDMLGTRIAAAAGYDPVRGAQFFARGEAVKKSDGQLSFWGTHPPDAKRIAVVIATYEEIQARQALLKRGTK